MIVTTETFDEECLALLIHASATLVGPLSGAKFGLFTNNLTLTKQTTLGLLTEATYTGYSQQVATWTAPTRDALGNINVESQLLAWQETTTPVDVSVFGWFLVDPTGATLLMAEVFPNGPYSLIDLLSILKFVVEFIQTNPNNAGQATIVS
jgi:hypothetical protein